MTYKKLLRKTIGMCLVAAMLLTPASAFGADTTDTGASNSGAAAQAAAGSAIQSAAAESTAAAPAKIPAIDTSQPDELKTPANPLKENGLSKELTVKGKQYDAAGLLTYKIENGKAIIMSCDPAVKGELYIPDYIEGCPVTAINDYAFLYCANLTALTLPATVTDIGDYAFCYCTQLASVTAGGTTSSGIVVGDHAFYRCYDLKKLDYGYIKSIGNYAFAYSGLSMTSFKEGLQTIGAYAFEGCGSLTTIKLPSSLTLIGDFAFASCAALTYAEFPARLTSDKTGGYIFYECEKLTGVKASDAWTRVPDGIFAECRSADPYSVMKDGMTEIGHGAFYNSNMISGRIDIPSTVIRIGSHAFGRKQVGRDYAAKSAIELELPSGLTYIGAYAFAYRYIGDELEIPDSVEKIGAGAFQSVYIQGKLTIPAKLSELGEGAFSTNEITELYIPASLSTIGAKAFEINPKLTRLTIDADSAAAGWGGYVFSNCTSLKSVRLPDAWTSVPAWIFYGCTALSDVNIPENAAELGAGAFCGCTSLKSIELPSALRRTGDSVFADSGLESVNIDNGLEEIGSRTFYKAKIKTLVIPASVTTIGEEAFLECRTLTSLKVNNGSLKSIGEAAFSKCSALKSVNIGSGLETIERKAFENCRALETVTLPSTLRYLGNKTTNSSSFSWCISLKNINLPEGLLLIGDQTFEHCTALKEITLPSTLQRSGMETFSESGLQKVTLADGMAESAIENSLRSAFTGAEELKSINIPASWTSIPKNFLRDCTGPLEITIPSGIKEIGMSAFEGCTGLTSINIPASVEKIGANAFYGAGLTSLSIPDSVAQENLGAYALGGCQNLSDVKLPSSWTTLPDGLFQGNTSITEYTVAENFTAIGEGAFKNSSIKNITLHNGITSIGEEAFMYCKNLSSLTLPSGLQTIGESAFDGCSGITQDELVIPGTLTKVETLAFAGLSSVKKITIESGVQTINGLAFAYCDSLTEAVVPDSVVNIAYSAFYDSNPGVLTLKCSQGSAAAKHAEAVLYVNSDYTAAVSGIKYTGFVKRIDGGDRENTECISFYAYGPYYYSAEYNGLQYEVRKNSWNSTSEDWETSYGTDFFAVAGITQALDAALASKDIVIPDYLGSSAVPVTTIDHSFSYSGSTVRSVTLGANVTTVEASAFKNCKNLVSVDMSRSSVTLLKDGAFDGCTALTNVKFPKTLTCIEWQAFRNCTALKSLDFTNTSLGQIYAKEAFMGCSSLTSVKFNEGLKWIDNKSFAGTALKDVYLPSSLEVLQLDAFDKGKVTYHFTGNATRIQYYYEVNNERHFASALSLLLEQEEIRVGQFFGKGLDKQDTYFISTGTAGLNVPYGMQSASVVFGIGGVPVGDPSSTADGELSSQASSDSISDAVPDSTVTDDAAEDESDVTEPKEKLVYEVVRDAIAENPLMTAAVIVIIAALATLGGLRRYRRSRRQG